MSDLYDSGLYHNDKSIVAIKPGTIIEYRLLPKDMPKHPDKVWHGKVLQCDISTLFIESLEPGYCGLTERITYKQITAIEK